MPGELQSSSSAPSGAHAIHVLPYDFAAQRQWRARHCADSRSNIELKENTTVVVLGASGDLAKKKTVGSPSQQEKKNNYPLWRHESNDSILYSFRHSLDWSV